MGHFVYDGWGKCYVKGVLERCTLSVTNIQLHCYQSEYWETRLRDLRKLGLDFLRQFQSFFACLLGATRIDIRSCPVIWQIMVMQYVSRVAWLSVFGNPFKMMKMVIHRFQTSNWEENFYSFDSWNDLTPLMCTKAFLSFSVLFEPVALRLKDFI